MLNVEAFTKVFDRLDRELWVITARASDRRSGLIATYVSRASLDPMSPRVTLGLAKHHYTHELIQTSNAFCMHLISEEQLDWVWRLGNRSGRTIDKLRGFETSEAASGSPILTGALAWLDCRVESRMDTGDRTVFLAEVLAGELLRDAAPLTFKRLLEVAPAKKLQAMKLAVEHDAAHDREAIAAWRKRQ